MFNTTSRLTLGITNPYYAFQRYARIAFFPSDRDDQERRKRRNEEGDSIWTDYCGSELSYFHFFKVLDTLAVLFTAVLASLGIVGRADSSNASVVCEGRSRRPPLVREGN